MSGLGSSRQEVKYEAGFARARGLIFDSDEKTSFYEPTNAYGSIYNSLLISSYDKGVKKGPRKQQIYGLVASASASLMI